MRICKIESCGQKHWGLDHCQFHYGKLPAVREKMNARQRKNRAASGNKETRKYEKTKRGFLMRAYRNMLSRVTGVQRKKAHLYKGKEILEKSAFYEWALKNKSFHRLFNSWEKSGYERKICPSVNRINSLNGYSIDNIEWITHSENSSRVSRSRYT